MAHAKLSPSGAERWMNCPGSVVLEADCAASTSEYADEGTAAHALAALCLTEQKDAKAFQGRRFAVVNGVYWPGHAAPIPPKLKGHDEEIVRHFDIDEDMVDYVQTYLANVRQYAAEGALLVEVALPLAHLTGEEGAQGTGDAVIFADEGEELQLHDLKYGRGKTVSPVRNKQLMTYGLAALVLAELTGHNVKRVRLVIHQPRVISAPQEWCLPIEELLALANEIGAAAALCDLAQTYQGKWSELHEKYLRPSDEACQWCNAKAVCPAKAQQMQEFVEASFEALVGDSPVGIPNPETLAERLGLKLDCVSQIEGACKAVRSEAERRLVNGEAVPSPSGGYKLVQGKKGPRQWMDPLAAEASLKSMRLKRDEMYNLKVISPTDADKLLSKDSPKRWASLQDNIRQSGGKLHVAPMADVRPAVAQEPVEGMFEPVVPASMEDLG